MIIIVKPGLTRFDLIQNVREDCRRHSRDFRLKTKFIFIKVFLSSAKCWPHVAAQTRRSKFRSWRNSALLNLSPERKILKLNSSQSIFGAAFMLINLRFCVWIFARSWNLKLVKLRTIPMQEQMIWGSEGNRLRRFSRKILKKSFSPSCAWNWSSISRLKIPSIECYK